MKILLFFLSFSFLYSTSQAFEKEGDAVKYLEARKSTVLELAKADLITKWAGDAGALESIDVSLDLSVRGTSCSIVKKMEIATCMAAGSSNGGETQGVFSITIRPDADYTGTVIKVDYLADLD